jgi:hypothetical protein
MSINVEVLEQSFAIVSLSVEYKVIDKMAGWVDLRI